MSCVRESSPQSAERVVNQRPEPKKRRFHPLRGLRRIFRRKAPASPEPNEVVCKSFDDALEQPPTTGLDTSRSRSTSRLIDEPFNCRRRSLHSTLLSVSHDSVFNPEQQQHSSQSDSESAVSVPRLGFPQANIQAELLAAVRRRRKIQDDDESDDVDEEDLGLPRSPSMHSPTIATGNDLLLSKELITKSSHSTCSDFSMGSSEMDEDSFGGGVHNSRYSSKISLHDKRVITSQTHLDSSDGEPSTTSVPLSHSAAKHRMAIRPKRKHGNPRSKKPLMAVTSALPATPEVNEEHSGRSASPETKKQSRTATDTTSTAAADGTAIITSTTITVTSATTTTTTATTAITTVTATDDDDDVTDVVETDDVADATVVVGSSSRDLDTSVDEISVENVVPSPRREEGFFHRLLSRRSTKKKTNANSSNKCTSASEDVDVDRFLFDESTGPLRPRQREEPPPAGRMRLSYPPDLPPDHEPAHDTPPQSTAEPNHPNRVYDESADTFVPIKRSFVIGQRTANGDDDDDDDEDYDGGGGGDGSSSSSSSSSDSVSTSGGGGAIVPDEPVDDDRPRYNSSSDSEQPQQQQQHVNGHHHHAGRCASPQSVRPLPVPAPRLSKLYNGGGGGGGDAAMVHVVRRKKRDEQQQQPELLKVFARRSLKLGKDGEPELLLLADDDCVEVAAAENEINAAADVEMDVNENHRTAAATATAVVLTAAVQNDLSSVEVTPRFKRIQQRREEWEKRLLQQ